ncbi:MAG: hypothetical protein M0R33_06040 [Methylomonas sp.]|jgi:hypothetical protein|uniref:hypothetical protein n=1 Tax=Methylomonas sp. TaxID=418 RepID=UPI0025E8A54E|nr:hypothetical protein [Methylomonas sp.]MCK9605996.1 hypothetical protein [Methylomonas sp.]
MSIENNNQDRLLADLDKSSAVNKSRRSFAKSGIAAPVIVSLASKPVFGAQCLSNALSINQSHAVSSCWGGWSPGAWKGPTGDGSPSQWLQAGFNYGTLKPGKSGQKWNHYDGGSKVNEFVFPSGYSFPSGITGNSYAREYLNTASNADAHLHYMAALLNIKYAAATGQHYIMNYQQFLGLVSGATPIPAPYASFADYVDANYHL